MVRYIQEMIENNWNKEPFTLPHNIASDIVGLNLDELTVGSHVRSVEGHLMTRGRYVTVGQHVVLRNLGDWRERISDDGLEPRHLSNTQASFFPQDLWCSVFLCVFE